jgi:hypothetical protein
MSDYYLFCDDILESHAESKSIEIIFRIQKLRHKNVYVEYQENHENDIY